MKSNKNKKMSVLTKQNADKLTTQKKEEEKH